MAPLYIRAVMGYKLGQNLLGFIYKESGRFRYRISRLSDSTMILIPKDPSRRPAECLFARSLSGVVP
jgi:hypothetical protein